MTFIEANEAQRAAITHREGACLVLAGPGSGKTFVITRRIEFLLRECGVPPERILVVTFTKEAALSMQRRFQKQSGNQIYPVSFGTFHSIFYHILRESHSLNTYRLAAESQRRKIALTVMSRLVSREGVGIEQTPTAEDAALFLSAIGFYKNTGEEEAAAGLLPREWRPGFREGVRGYEEEKKRRSLLDFDDMVCQCKELLRDDAKVRANWQSRFSHILMDEFQDINPVQYETVKLLSGKGTRLFAVGDDDQAIYGFRGSSPACLRKFAEEYGARQIYLTVNYRSCGEIVEASRLMVSENKERFPKALTAARGKERCGQGGAPVRLAAFQDREEQYEYLAKELYRGISGNHKEADSLAVLFRTNSYMQGFATLLERRGVPYHMKERVSSIYGHFVVRDVFAYLRLSEGPPEREALLRILNRPLRYLNREALGQGTGDLFQNMRSFYEKQPQLAYGRERLLAVDRLERELCGLRGLPMYLKVQYILKGIGYESYLRERAGAGKEKMQEWQEVFEWLKGEAGQYDGLKEWLEAKAAYEERLGGRKGEKNTEEGPLRVQLMTAHASKGLEFDRVWIPDCNENVFPHGRMTEGAVCEEERRIFYVAMTRAKKSLELLYLTGTKERPRLPSRFLNPLLSSGKRGIAGNACYSRESPPVSSSNSQLSRNSSNASAARSYSSSSSI